MRKATTSSDGKEPKCNVRVCVRGRPINQDEIAAGNTNIVKYDGKTIICKNKNYGQFDEVFDPSFTQKAVFDRVVKPQVDRVLAGFNCTVFAYGQTGTGKTYTMEGGQSDAVDSNHDPTTGMTPRAVEMVFSELEKSKTEEFTVRVSFVELYNEELYDLLAPFCEERERLRLYDDPSKKGAVLISGVEEIPVRTRQEVFDLLRRGSERRTTAATLMNRNSSRSHSIFTVTVVIRENNDAGEELVKTGKLNLVDLAGSENINRSGAEGKRVKEAGNINQSLLTLGRVITSLTSSAPHIPYRESKLTRMLQDSLGGSTITSIIATISPASCNFEETVSTLEYAMRAKNIKNHPECNQKVSRKALLKEYNVEIERLRRDLYAARQKTGGVYLSTESYEEMERNLNEKEKRIDELSESLEIQFTKLQQFIEDMTFMDQQYKDLYKLNSRFRTKLESRVTELDDAKKKLCETEGKLTAYTGAFKEIHQQAKVLFFELQLTRETVRTQEAEAEQWWKLEDHLTDINATNQRLASETVTKICEHVKSAEQKLDFIMNLTNKATENLATKTDEVGLSSSTDINVVRSNIDAVRHLLEGLKKDCLELVKSNVEDRAKSVSSFVNSLGKHTSDLMNATKDTSDLLLQLTESITKSQSGITEVKEELLKDISAWVTRERGAIVDDKREREQLQQEGEELNSTFNANSLVLVNQLITLIEKKREDDETLFKKWNTLDLEMSKSHCNRTEELPVIMQSFDDISDDHLKKIKNNVEEIEPRIECNREYVKSELAAVTAETTNFVQLNEKCSEQIMTDVEADLTSYVDNVSSKIVLAADACDRVDLSLDDLATDIKTISQNQLHQVTTEKENLDIVVGQVDSLARTLKRGWTERSCDIESPSRQHHNLDMTLLTDPPTKVEKLLENHGISQEVNQVTKTRESLLDLVNVPLSPATVDRQKKVKAMDMITEEDTENSISTS